MGLLVGLREGIRSVARYFASQKPDTTLLQPELYEAGKAVRVVVCSDTHNGVVTQEHADAIPDADIFLCCGDVTETGTEKELHDFNNFLGLLKHKVKIVQGGNHDRKICPRLRRKLDKGGEGEQGTTAAGADEDGDDPAAHKKFIKDKFFANATHYLEGDVIVVPVREHQVVICGMPYTDLFPGATASVAFVLSEEEQMKKFREAQNMLSTVPLRKKPNRFDILMTHGPPRNILDTQATGSRIGSLALSRFLVELATTGDGGGGGGGGGGAPLVHAFGHVHSSRGIVQGTTASELLGDAASASAAAAASAHDLKVPTTFINAASVTGKTFVFDVDVSKLALCA